MTARRSGVLLGFDGLDECRLLDSGRDPAPAHVGRAQGGAGDQRMPSAVDTTTSRSSGGHLLAQPSSRPIGGTRKGDALAVEAPSRSSLSNHTAAGVSDSATGTAPEGLLRSGCLLSAPAGSAIQTTEIRRPALRSDGAQHLW